MRFLLRPIVYALAAAVLLGRAVTGRAQDGTIRGTVSDSMGKPIQDADVAIVELHQLTRTDAGGRFTFTKLPRGAHEVSIRRLGYAPDSIKVIVNEMAYAYNVTLLAQAAVLQGIEVDASEARLARGIEEFYRRRARGSGGTFYTRDDILAHNTHRTSDVLRTAPGVRFVRTRTGSGLRFSASAGGRRDCIPVVWLDGQPVEGMEIDDVPANDIEGIELYSGASTTPMQFSQRQNKDNCGAIVIWSRIPGKP